MSRTKKDRPYRVKALDACKAGRIEHRHNMLGMSRSGTYIKTVDIPKADAAAVSKFRNELVAAGASFTEDEVSVSWRSRFNGYIMGGVVGSKKPVVVGPYSELDIVELKRIRFSIEHSFEKTYYTRFCTDAEHYDAERGIDTRDGLPVACVPVVTDNNKHGCGCTSCAPQKNRYSKAARRDSLVDIRKAYNSGYEVEELDEFDAPEIVNEYGPRNWAFSD